MTIKRIQALVITDEAQLELISPDAADGMEDNGGQPDGDTQPRAAVTRRNDYISKFFYGESNEVPLQLIYDWRAMTGFVSGQDLHRFYQALVGEPSPSGYALVAAEQLRSTFLKDVADEECCTRERFASAVAFYHDDPFDDALGTVKDWDDVEDMRKTLAKVFCAEAVLRDEMVIVAFSFNGLDYRFAFDPMTDDPREGPVLTYVGNSEYGRLSPSKYAESAAWGHASRLINEHLGSDVLPARED